MSVEAVVSAPDGLPRCPWSANSAEELPYHDTEWGFPVADDRRLFEKLCLESFQSGLSWRTILNKREAFRAAFAGFDYQVVAEFGGDEVSRLLDDAAIVRNRAKIEATINNAQRMAELVEREGSLASFAWSYEPEQHRPEEAQTRSTSPESIAMSKELKRRGWKFLGPTTVFAFMQAMGLLNDHLPDCVIRDKAADARSRFSSPASRSA